MISAKTITLGLLKIKVCWNKGYNVITSVHDVTKKSYHVHQMKLQIWSCDQSFVTLAFLWENLNFIRIWPGKQLFWEVVLIQVQ